MDVAQKASTTHRGPRPRPGRTNERTKRVFFEMGKKRVGVGLINTRFGPHKREKGFCLFARRQKRRDRIWKDISLGEKKGITKRSLSLSLESR